MKHPDIYKSITVMPQYNETTFRFFTDDVDISNTLVKVESDILFPYNKETMEGIKTDTDIVWYNPNVYTEKEAVNWLITHKITELEDQLQKIPVKIRELESYIS